MLVVALLVSLLAFLANVIFSNVVAIAFVAILQKSLRCHYLCFSLYYLHATAKLLTLSETKPYTHCNHVMHHYPL